MVAVGYNYISGVFYGNEAVNLRGPLRARKRPTSYAAAREIRRGGRPGSGAAPETKFTSRPANAGARQTPRSLL
jgi:hypothetical protein